MKYKNVILVGTNHIAQKSIEKIKKTFEDNSPDIVCLELDKNRYPALFQKSKPSLNPALILKVGVKGYLFSLIGGFVQRYLAKKTGMTPGVDMRTAALLAKEKKIKILLIDQDIQKTLWNISHRISKQDKKNFWLDLWWSLILSILGVNLFFKIFKSKKITNRVKNRILSLTSKGFSIKDIPNQDIIEELMIKLEFIYPSLYKILVHDRNRYMATNLHNIMLRAPNKCIVVIVGAAHVSGMYNLLRKFDSEI